MANAPRFKREKKTKIQMGSRRPKMCFFSYVFMISEVNGISIDSAISHSMINTLEIILVVTGIVSIAVIIMNFINSKNESKITNTP